MEEISLSEIIIDRTVQLGTRGVDQYIVMDYAEAYGNQAPLPPIILFRVSDQLILADGFHRVQALRMLSRETALAEVREGTLEDARVHAALSNIANGRPMSRAEKQEAGLRLFKYTGWSDREIARRLAVNNATVSRWRESYDNHGKPKENVANATPPYSLLCADFRAAEIAPESVDVILTDPPYPREYLHLYAALAERAAAWLKPDGVLLCMTGQSYLPEILPALAAHLDYRWTIAYLTPGGQSPQIWGARVNTFWKPVLCFVRHGYDYKTRTWTGDVVRSDVNDNDKDHHRWGQSESGMARLIETYTYAGDLILDPMMGAGTTGVVAIGQGRRFIGIDIDSEAVEAARIRMETAWRDYQ